MENQDLVIQLIHQDMKHQQLVEAICRIGFETDQHNLQLMEIVARLMGQPEGEIPDTWVETYMDYLGKSVLYSPMARGESLEALARECYAQLAR